MYRATKLFLMAFSVGAAALLAGCQSSDHQPASAAAASEQAVTCSKCKVTYFQTPVAKNSVVKYTTSKMECPDCKSAAATFFSTGKFQHSCKTCGDTLEICELHQ